MKNISRATKNDIITFLEEKKEELKKSNSSLYERTLYALAMYRKSPTKVLKSDLIILLKEIERVAKIEFNFSPALVENSLKPVEKQEEKKVVVVEEQKKKVLKKTTKKPVAKEEKKDSSFKKKVKSIKDSLVKVLNKEEAKASEAILLADVFAEEITVNDDEENTSVTYTIAHDIKDMKDLLNCIMNKENIVFAMYWSKRHLLQFPYFNGNFKAPEQFPYDLDFSTCFYVSDNLKCAYAMSMYSEGIYLFLPESITETNGLRFCNGIEYQIYRQN